MTNNDCEGAGENFKIIDEKNNPFFPTSASLTVSGQLNAEALSMGLKKDFTFGPTFSADRSHTNQHLAEFWMVELEIAFCNLKDLMKIIEQMFKTIIQKTMNKCHAEFNYLVKKHKKHASNFTKNDYFKIYKITL